MEGKDQMNTNDSSPKQMVDNQIEDGVKKANSPLLKTILLGIFAGMFVGIGAQGSNFAVHSIENLGVAKTLAGTIFPVGLMMIIIVGGQLFTGNCLLIMPILNKKLSIGKGIKNLILVYVSNFFGAALLALLVSTSGQFAMNHGAVGAYTIKVALGKVNVDFTQALISGILCNVIVCLAILMASKAKDMAGKCLTIFFAIWVFVISSFEHCVANMYYLPAGILAAKNDSFVEKANELYGITSKQIKDLNFGTMFSNNLLPVTIGNIIGGALFVGSILYVIHKSSVCNQGASCS